jgi:hypothetical protein
VLRKETTDTDTEVIINPCLHPCLTIGLLLLLLLLLMMIRITDGDRTRIIGVTEIACTAMNRTGRMRIIGTVHPPTRILGITPPVLGVDGDRTI